MPFDHSSLRWFEARPCRPASRGPPSSVVQQGCFRCPSGPPFCAVVAHSSLAYQGSAGSGHHPATTHSLIAVHFHWPSISLPSGIGESKPFPTWSWHGRQRRPNVHRCKHERQKRNCARGTGVPTKSPPTSMHYGRDDCGTLLICLFLPLLYQTLS